MSLRNETGACCFFANTRFASLAFNVVGLNCLADLLEQQVKPADAEALYRESLAIQTKLFGSSHPRTIQWVQELKALLEREGKQAEAKALAEDLPATAPEIKSEPR